MKVGRNLPVIRRALAAAGKLGRAVYVERATMAILPWLIPLLGSLIAITLIPEITLWLPRMAGLVK